MTLEIIRDTLAWCSLINIILLAWWFLFFYLYYLSLKFLQNSNVLDDKL